MCPTSSRHLWRKISVADATPDKVQYMSGFRRGNATNSRFKFETRLSKVSAMRANVTVAKLRRFMTELAGKGKGGGAVYFTGGATALLLEMREQTIDVDVAFDPEPGGVFEAMAELKNSLDLNVELACPADFIPVPLDWKAKSHFITEINGIAFYHYDLRAQALAKIERGHGHDLEDARGFLKFAKISGAELWQAFSQIKAGLVRYPAIDPASFEAKVARFLKGTE